MTGFTDHGIDHGDSAVDLAGYAALLQEIA